MPAEYRRTVVTATWVAAGQLPAVLTEPAPQRGLAGCGQHLGADTHHPAAAVGAVLAVFVEEVGSRRVRRRSKGPAAGSRTWRRSRAGTAARLAWRPACPGSR